MHRTAPACQGFLLLSFIGLLFTTAIASNGAVFVTNNIGTDQPFTFALTVDDDGDDFYFHMSAPGKHAWMSVGTGNEMDDSFMIVVYAGEDDSEVTISPRVAIDGTSEPTYYPRISCETTGASSMTSSLMVVNAVCRNVTAWEKARVDLTSTEQPFIFALGPGDSMHSDSLSAPMLRHQIYGQFTLDMTVSASNGEGGTPAPNSGNSYTIQGASAAEDVKTGDNDWGAIIHAIVMCLAFVIVFPLGGLLLRMLDSVRWHAICQFIALVITLVGSGIGLYISFGYNRSRNVNSAHQIIGIFIFLLVIVQFALGFVHHRIYKRQQRSTILGKVHLWLGPLVIVLGLINAPLGFNLACEYTRPRMPDSTDMLDSGLRQQHSLRNCRRCGGRHLCRSPLVQVDSG
jgi:hypothetical protein